MSLVKNEPKKESKEVYEYPLCLRGQPVLPVKPKGILKKEGPNSVEE